MNRKQRRAARSQIDLQAMITFRGHQYTTSEADRLAINAYREGNHQVALDIYDLILAKIPEQAAPHNNRGIVLQEINRYDEAFLSFGKAIAIDPNLADAHNNYALILHKMKRYDAAITGYHRALAIKPDYAEAYNNLGMTQNDIMQFREALANFERAIALKPDYAKAYSNRGNAFQEIRNYVEALASFEKAAALGPDVPYLLGMLQHTRMQLCEWRDKDQLIERLTKGIAAGRPVASPFAVLAITDSLLQQRKCAEIYVTHQFPQSPSKLWNGDRYEHEKMRIAYVSADFREHPMSYLMAGVFEQHDKSRFEIYGISLRPEASDAMGRRVKAAFNHFVDVSHKGDYEVAQLLRNLEIDIAIDLMGFTSGGRTNIFAYRPAPVQINYLGYPGTMGADCIDYIIADEFVIPVQCRSLYSEKIAYLPGCFQANDDKRYMAEQTAARAKNGLPEQAFVFCSFNTSYKITPEVFDIWMYLLNAVPGSVLWLLGEGTVRSNLCREAYRRGVEPSRLIFAAGARYDEHLRRLQNADLFLDTFPFNAGTTASDILWAGVPLVTCSGQAFASRMAGSLLSAMDVSELITDNLADYKALAMALATDHGRLAGIRTKIARNRTDSPLFNTAEFTKHLEAAFTEMWRNVQNQFPRDHHGAS